MADQCQKRKLDRDGAETVAAAMRVRGTLTYPADPTYNAYACEDCGSFHVGRGTDYVDREITCKGCGEPFLFAGGEQVFFAKKGIPEPKRCKPCRVKQRERFAEIDRIRAEKGKAA